MNPNQCNRRHFLGGSAATVVASSLLNALLPNHLKALEACRPEDFDPTSLPACKELQSLIETNMTPDGFGLGGGVIISARHVKPPDHVRQRHTIEYDGNNYDLRIMLSGKDCRDHQVVNVAERSPEPNSLVVLVSNKSGKITFTRNYLAEYSTIEKIGNTPVFNVAPGDLYLPGSGRIDGKDSGSAVLAHNHKNNRWELIGIVVRMARPSTDSISNSYENQQAIYCANLANKQIRDAIEKYRSDPSAISSDWFPLTTKQNIASQLAIAGTGLAAIGFFAKYMIPAINSSRRSELDPY